MPSRLARARGPEIVPAESQAAFVGLGRAKPSASLPPASVPPRHEFPTVCRCPSVDRRGGRANGLCACRHPLAGANCGCECANGRAAWCEHCRSVAALPPATEEEKARAARELIEAERADLAPQWERLGERGRTAMVMHQYGMRGKAKRFAICGRVGFAADCQEIDAHRFYQRFRCGSRYCAQCGPATMAALINRHQPAIVAFLEREPVRRGWTLAQITLTVRADGGAVQPDDVRQFNSRVKKCFRLIQERELYQTSTDRSARPGFIWCDEFGFEGKGRRAIRAAAGRNIHCHGIYYGPLLDWARVRDLWRELTGATGCYVQQVRGWKKRQMGDCRWKSEVAKALYYALKYTGKPLAATPERIAELEWAFHRVRRFHAVGAFYKLPPAEASGAPAPRGPECPCCGGALIVSRQRLPLDSPGMQERRDLEEARREAGRVRAMGAAPPTEGRRK